MLGGGAAGGGGGVGVGGAGESRWDGGGRTVHPARGGGGGDSLERQCAGVCQAFAANGERGARGAVRGGGGGPMGGQVFVCQGAGGRERRRAADFVVAQ